MIVQEYGITELYIDRGDAVENKRIFDRWTAVHVYKRNSPPPGHRRMSPLLCPPLAPLPDDEPQNRLNRDILCRLALLRFGYPPDLQDEAVKTVLAQANLLCAEWAA